MYFARKMLLLAVAVGAIMALTASSAAATNHVEFVRADSQTPCPTLAAGGCAFHSEGEITLDFHILGFEGAEAKCHIEFRGNVDHRGNGRITAYTVTPGKHDADCSNATMPACSLPWPFSTERDADGKVRAHIDSCVDPAESGVCSGEIILIVSESGTTTETQTHTATDLRIGSSSFCEVTLSKSSEAVAPEGQETHINTI